MRARPTSSRSSCASSSIPPGSWHKVGDETRCLVRRSPASGPGPGGRVVSLDPHERLIVALDVPSVAEAEKVVVRLGESVSFYKIGYQLAFAGGIDFAKVLAAAGKHVFLDLKLHDIGNTVAKGVESVAQLGATFLTVHAYPQTMKAAVEGKKGSRLRILAVTVLTSYDDADLAAARAGQARDMGIDGLVCSAEEAAKLREIAGPGMALVTPGIRPAGAA